MSAPGSLIPMACAAAMIALASGCASTAPAPESIALPSTSSAPLAIAHISGASGSLVSGTLRLAPTAEGVRITGTVGGLAPGSHHGLHVHANGNCTAADATSAGDVFGPPALPMHG